MKKFLILGLVLVVGCAKSFIPDGSYKVTVHTPNGVVVYRGIEGVCPTDAGGWHLYDTKSNKVIYVSKGMGVVIERE